MRAWWGRAGESMGAWERGSMGAWGDAAEHSERLSIRVGERGETWLSVISKAEPEPLPYSRLVD